MAQRPSELRPELSPLHLFGARLRLLREQRGLSQARLGAEVFVSGDLIGRIEKGERRAQPDLARRCDEALGSGNELSALLAWATTQPGENRADVLDHIPALRRVLDMHDLPEEGLHLPQAFLEASVRRMVDDRLNSRYLSLAVSLPAVIAGLHCAVRGPERQRCRVLLAQAYRAADAIADKFGLHDLSARIIGLMGAVALESGDQAVIAASSYVRAETFFATGDWGSGRRMLERAADTVAPRNKLLSAGYGALHMRAAVLAACDGKTDVAAAHIQEAASVARKIPEGMYCGTAFGPDSVRIHHLALAVESGDPAGGLAIAGGWIPPVTMPAERRSHFFVDLARAQVQAGFSEDATESLGIARQIAPEHIRQHPQVRAAVAQLLGRRVSPPGALAELARWARVLPAIAG